MRAPDPHSTELRRLLAFFAGCGALAVLPYLVPGAELVRAWVPGEPVPLLHLALGSTRVVEGEDGLLLRQAAGDGAEAGPEAPAEAPPDPLADPGAAPEAPAPDGPLPDGDAVAELSAPAAAPDAAPEAGQTAALAAARPPRPPAAAPEVDRSGAAAPPAPGPAVGEDQVLKPGLGKLPDRSPAKGTPLEIPPGALDAWFAALARAEAGSPGAVARALHWGDSTIASDGITRTVRARLQSRFGDGGPGFLAVQVDPRWAARPSVLRKPSGAWRTRNITFGGAGNGYYGLAGTVSTASGSAQSVLGGSEVDGQRQLLHRFDLAFQVAPGGGTLTLEVEGQPPVQLATHADAVGDAWHPVQVPQGARTVTVSAAGDGPVTVYGIALETAGPGVTWETLGVAGASQTSIFRQGRNHLARQIAHREPDLIVYQMGGNELGYPSLKGNGKVWRERYVEVVQRLRAGAPEASCLLVTPLDQGERVRGEVHSKPTLNNMIRLQREVARELGCAFWDARAAMGGPGSFGTWMSKKLAWSDLYHLTGKGLSLVGNTLADAMEVAYDDWRRRNPVVAADTAGPGRG